jgi:hypothetical protein
MSPNRTAKKLARQNEAVVAFWPTGEPACAGPWGNFLWIYRILPQVCPVPLRKPRDTFSKNYVSRRFWQRQFFRPLDNEED